jgi:hypothetical protein
MSAREFRRACTNLVTGATDVEFQRNVGIVAAEMGLYVVHIESEESIADRRQRGWGPSEEIGELMSRAESNPNAIIYGMFYTYPFEST